PACQPLLVLPGALGTAESAWRILTLLEKEQFHLLCPGYPPQCDTMSSLAEGVAELLVHEGIVTTFVLGGAYGSMLAQVLTHRHPEMVEKLVLSHAYPPLASRVKSIHTSLRLFSVAPMFLVKRILRLQMTGRLPANPSAEMLVIEAQIHETIDTRLTRQDALNIFSRMSDFDRQQFSPADLVGWQGETLLMFEEDDPTTPEQLRQELLANYPGARVHMLSNTSQGKAILESGEYSQVLKAFFARKE
ncbi:MAG: alpha/beta fold hydrolase, partial [Acidobacteriaceae bacterium]